MTTQGAIFNYEEVIDLHTETGRVSVIGIHTPTGDTPRQLCPGFFQQFKRYKYLGCSVSVVPVATLPADPLSVSYEAGEPTMDPRDLANPMMFHGCHGNDLGNILNRLYSSGLVDGNDLTQILHSDSIDLINMFNADDDGEPVLQLLESLYYRALTDNTWKKAHIQRGFRKSGLKPRIYSLATNMQIRNATALGGFNAPAPFTGDSKVDPLVPFAGFEDVTDPEDIDPVRYFTPRTVPLGWLDTRQVVPYVAEGNVGDVSLNDLDTTIKNLVRGKAIWNELPKIFMGVILMPPAYKTEQYFRVIINHAFAFKGFRGISMSNDMLDMPPNYQNWNELLTDGDSTEPDDPQPDPDPPVDPTDQYSVALSYEAGTGNPHIATLYNYGVEVGYILVPPYAGYLAVGNDHKPFVVLVDGKRLTAYNASAGTLRLTDNGTTVSTYTLVDIQNGALEELGLQRNGLNAFRTVLLFNTTVLDDSSKGGDDDGERHRDDTDPERNG